MDELKKNGIEDIIGSDEKSKYIVKDMVECDLYRILDGETEELKDNFQEGITELGKTNNMTTKEVLVKLKLKYDGYRFSRNAEGVYNPFSLLSAMNNRDFNNYWFSTGTPTFLVNMMKKFHADLTQIDGSEAAPEEFDAPTKDGSRKMQNGDPSPN